mmetsp:Transcript_17638/g.24813  ORF Transcript_17638/g.24813 Transcript_17638/m.24813 type:complete len:614 (-) Transcript_17638:396-2237(-)
MSNPGGDNADACVPQALTDFVFDLYDSVTSSQIPEEQRTFYKTTFADLCAKYFSTSPWPSPQAIASECNGDPLFLALYREVTHRHWHSVGRPTIRDRIEGWHVYKELFDEILEDAEDGGSSASRPNFYILPEWTFDILHEFVYQFQGFCQFRHSLHNSATKHGLTLSSSNGGQIVSSKGGSASTEKDADKDDSNDAATDNKKINAPPHIVDNLTVVSQNRDAWAVESVLYYLHRLIAIGTSPKCTVPAYQYLGIFASVTLSRLECLVGDYTGCLDALSPILSSSSALQVMDEGLGGADNNSGGVQPQSAIQVVKSVFAARLSLAYHAGVSYLMLRRYKDAIRTLGEICSLHGFKTGQLRKDQIGKIYDRMIALLAILTHIAPGATGGTGTSSSSSSSSAGAVLLEDSVIRTIRDKHGSTLSKIDAGEEGYEDLFMFACPKFVLPAIPDYSKPSTPQKDNAYKQQVTKFQNEMMSQHTTRKLRSYMKLYTSIDVTKLASFNDTTTTTAAAKDEAEKQFLPTLIAYKHKMKQLECHSDEDETASSSSSPVDGKIGSALDIHYYITNNEDDTNKTSSSMVHVDEAEKQRRFENFFMGQISQNIDILKDVETMSTKV